MDFALTWQPFPVVINCYIRCICVQHTHIHTSYRKRWTLLSSLTFHTDDFHVNFGVNLIFVLMERVHSLVRDGHTLSFAEIHFIMSKFTSSYIEGDSLFIKDWFELSTQQPIWTCTETTLTSWIDVQTQTHSKSENESEDHCLNEVQFIIYTFSQCKHYRLYQE